MIRIKKTSKDLVVLTTFIELWQIIAISILILAMLGNIVYVFLKIPFVRSLVCFRSDNGTLSQCVVENYFALGPKNKLTIALSDIEGAYLVKVIRNSNNRRERHVRRRHHFGGFDHREFYNLNLDLKNQNDIAVLDFNISSIPKKSLEKLNQFIHDKTIKKFSYNDNGPDLLRIVCILFVITFILILFLNQMLRFSQLTIDLKNQCVKAKIATMLSFIKTSHKYNFSEIECIMFQPKQVSDTIFYFLAIKLKNKVIPIQVDPIGETEKNYLKQYQEIKTIFEEIGLRFKEVDHTGISTGFGAGRFWRSTNTTLGS